MRYKLPKADEMSKAVQDALESYITWHICECYGVHRVQDLTVTEMQGVMAEYFDQKSMSLDSIISNVLRNIINTWESANGKNILQGLIPL